MTYRDTFVRYSALTAVIALVIAAPFGTATAGAAAAQPNEDEYSVTQGGECTTVKPLGDGHLTVEEFYDYRTPNTTPSSNSYSSHGTRHLQKDDTSLIFLHNGGDGLSLVTLHERYGDGSDGGAATMTFTGLPADGEWVVEDDGYEGRSDEFDHRDTSSRITWVYSANGTDGAAFNGGLDDEFSIEVRPRFNEDAAKQVYDGEITDWQLVSANATGAEYTSLNMEQPIEISSGGCTSYAVTELDATKSVTPGESTEIEATVENDGETAGTFTVPITVDGATVAERNVTLDPGETTTLSANVTLEESGTHTVAVANEEAEVTAGDGSEGGDELPGFGVGVALAAILIALVARYRS